ncbi:uncharacterized protein LOC141592990 isoform X3 [Silene latifolia]|uniref:uncharacterized protein LOC141592990 isoform X3 n=1 Tax=Silene latifolia TaxID=37657 RepID=UPI003D7755B1
MKRGMEEEDCADSLLLDLHRRYREGCSWVEFEKEEPKKALEASMKKAMEEKRCADKLLPDLHSMVGTMSIQNSTQKMLLVDGMMTRLIPGTFKHAVIQEEPLYHFAHHNEILDLEFDCDKHGGLATMVVVFVFLTL